MDTSNATANTSWCKPEIHVQRISLDLLKIIRPEVDRLCESGLKVNVVSNIMVHALGTVMASILAAVPEEQCDVEGFLCYLNRQVIKFREEITDEIEDRWEH